MGKKCRHNHREIAFQVLYSLYFRNAETIAQLEEHFLSCLDTAREQEVRPAMAKSEAGKAGGRDAGKAAAGDTGKAAGKDAGKDAGTAAGETAEMRPARKPEGFGWELVRGVWEHRERLDSIISDFSRRGLDRIGRTELVILRLGAWELLQPEAIDARIILSEAIILAHDFGDENSYQFINGILHSIATAVAEKKLAL